MYAVVPVVSPPPVYPFQPAQDTPAGASVATARLAVTAADKASVGRENLYADKTTTDAPVIPPVMNALTP